MSKVKVEEYRARAKECENQAAVARDTYVRAQLWDLAQQWREMADEVERRNRRALE
jgi:hypothetical protein